MPSTEPLAWFGGRLATGLADLTDDLAALESHGWWAVVVTFEGRVVCARFDDVGKAPLPAAPWPGVPLAAWSSSVGRDAYVAGVGRIREGIAAGEYYQVNLCRVLSAPLPPGADLLGLATLLAEGNPAPYAGVVRLPAAGVEVVTASPELFLRRTGDVVESGPIKGTAPTSAGLTEKDRAENVMIVDLVRNDLGAVARDRLGRRTGSERRRGAPRPGAPGVDRAGPAAPRRRLAGPAGRDVPARLGDRGAEVERAVRDPRPRDHAPRSVLRRRGLGGRRPRACHLAVGIRTFWSQDDRLRLGTGAGITWGSDAAAEWDETELKARRLLDVAAREG